MVERLLQTRAAAVAAVDSAAELEEAAVISQ